MALNLIALIIQIIVSVIVISPILWLVGRGLVSKEKAKFTDAVWIVALGVIVGVGISNFIHGFLGLVITTIIILALIKHFFDCGWGKAILVAIIAFVLLVVIVLILGILFGIGLAALIGIGFP